MKTEPESTRRVLDTTATKLGVCLGVVLLVLLTNCPVSHADPTQKFDVSYLKSRSRTPRTMIEPMPGRSLKIETRSGAVYANMLEEGERVTEEAAGPDASDRRKVGRKSGVTSFALSYLLPGGGQFYNGEHKKGAMMLGATVVGIGLALTAASMDSDNDDELGECDFGIAFGLILWSVSWIYSMIDAPISSARINRENDAAMGYRVPTNVYVDVDVSSIGFQTTPFIRARLSF